MFINLFKKASYWNLMLRINWIYFWSFFNSIYIYL